MYDHRQNHRSPIDPTYLVPGLPVFEGFAQGLIDAFSRTFRFLSRLVR